MTACRVTTRRSSAWRVSTAFLLAEQAPKGAAQIVSRGDGLPPLGALIDLGAEKARLGKGDRQDRGRNGEDQRQASNEKFVANANPEVVAAERERPRN